MKPSWNWTLYGLAVVLGCAGAFLDAGLSAMLMVGSLFVLLGLGVRLIQYLD